MNKEIQEGAEKMKQWRRDSHNKANKAYRFHNKEKIKAYNEAYYERKRNDIQN